MKVKLVLQPNQFSSFTCWYLEPLWRKYFDNNLISNGIVDIVTDIIEFGELK